VFSIFKLVVVSWFKKEGELAVICLKQLCPLALAVASLCLPGVSIGPRRGNIDGEFGYSKLVLDFRATGPELLLNLPF
jgi:hypothetical protein